MNALKTLQTVVSSIAAIAAAGLRAHASQGDDTLKQTVSQFSLALTLHPLGVTEWSYLALVVTAGTLVGVVPAWRAYRSSLADGLSPKL